MEAYDTIRTVLAVRQYEDRPLPMGLVRRIVESARLTGSSRNGQPWSFIVVENRDTLQKLGAAAHTGRYIAQAQFAIAVAIEDTNFAVSDASRAIQSMILTAWAEGVGSNWVGFFGLDEAKTILGVPEDLDLFAIVPFGFPARKIGCGKKNRKPLMRVAYRERFGQPFV